MILEIFMSVELKEIGSEKTMTLKEITDLLDVRHDNAMRVVEKMLEDKSFGSSPQIEEMKINGSGTFKTYLLDKRQSMAVSAKLNTALLMRVIDRWQELENKQPVIDPANLTKMQILEMAIQSEKELEATKLVVAKQQQTIQVKDDLIKVSNEASIKAGEVLVREFVKSQDIIDIGERQFFKWMHDQKLIFSDRNEPYQKYVNQGYLTYKPSEEMHGGKFRYTLRITPRGKVWLSAKYMAYVDTFGFFSTGESVEPRNGLVIIQGGAL